MKLDSEIHGAGNSNAHRALSLRGDSFQVSCRCESETMTTELYKQLHRKMWERFLIGQSHVWGML